jgi:hypothetical protein
MRNSIQHGPALLTVCYAALFASGACALDAAASKGSGQDGPGLQRLTESYQERHAARRRPGIGFPGYYVRTVASASERRQ